MTTHEVLARAKALLVNDGWRRDGSWHGLDGDGPYCVLGAINKAAKGQHVPAKVAVARAAGLKNPEKRYASLMRWNDCDVDTFTEVIDAFDRALIATAPEPLPSLTSPDPVPA